MVIRIDAVVIRERVRADLGDLSALASSIAARGLIHPIALDHNNVLVAGHRRLEACKQLGWSEIDYTVIDPGDTLGHLLAERDENTCRKAFTPKEMHAMAQRIEDREREAAKARQSAAGGRKVSQKRDASGQCPEAVKGQARDKIAAAIGTNSRTLRRINVVMDRGTPELQDAMDAGEVPISRAASIAKLPAHEQREALSSGKPIKPPRAPVVDMRRLVTPGSTLSSRHIITRIRAHLDEIWLDDPDAPEQLTALITDCEQLKARIIAHQETEKARA